MLSEALWLGRKPGCYLLLGTQTLNSMKHFISRRMYHLYWKISLPSSTNPYGHVHCLNIMTSEALKRPCLSQEPFPSPWSSLFLLLE